MTTRLLLVPQSFPFGHYADFLRDEIGYLAARFDEIVVAPYAPSGAVQATPANVRTDLRLAGLVDSRWRRVLAARRALPLLTAELRLTRRPLRHPGALGALLAAAGFAAEVRRWARPYAEDGVDTVGLTVWMGPATLGLASSGLPVATRAHRGDLFVQHMGYQYAPLQGAIVAAAQRVSSVSDVGAEDLRSRFPAHAAKINTRRLGIPGSDRLSRASDDGVLRVVSCSTMTKPKRPLLLAESIRALAERSDRVRWDHFGDGPMMDDFMAAVAGAKSTLELVMHGHRPNTEVLRHYVEHPVDVFVSVSDSEGLPVSMMEANSAGIPVIGTDAGGVREIVVDGVSGRLLEVDTTSVAVADTIVAVIAESMSRRVIRKWWAANFSADRNYTTFADESAALTVPASIQ